MAPLVVGRTEAVHRHCSALDNHFRCNPERFERRIPRVWVSGSTCYSIYHSSTLPPCSFASSCWPASCKCIAILSCSSSALGRLVCVPSAKGSAHRIPCADGVLRTGERAQSTTASRLQWRSQLAICYCCFPPHQSGGLLYCWPPALLNPCTADLLYC